MTEQEKKAIEVYLTPALADIKTIKDWLEGEVPLSAIGAKLRLKIVMERLQAVLEGLENGTLEDILP